MRGYVLHSKGDAAWTEVPVPPLGPYDAMVRPTAVATCTTDVHLIETAALPAAVGKPIGHEGVGVVEEVGDLAKDFRGGDRVVVPGGASDWRNPKAQRGEAKYYQGNNPYFTDDPSVGGVFSERVRVRDADMSLAHIPDSVSDIQAVMVPDMVATGFTGVERMEIEYGDAVAVIGSDPVGLMGISGAALRGAGRIIAVGSRPKTLDLARRYGATDTVDYKQGPILDQVLQLTIGAPVDSVLIASGGSASDMFTTALRMVKPGGHVACVSAFLDQDSVTVPLDVWNYGAMERFLTGVFVKDGRDPGPLVTHTLTGWEQLAEGLALMGSRDPNVIKPVVLP